MNDLFDNINSDFATGKSIDLSKPEEPVRQDTERWLVEQLGYEKNRLDIEYRIRAGSRTVKPDITIFRKPLHPNMNQHKDILGLVETKSKSIPEAEEQLHSYMAVCSSCEWGIAATAETRQFYRRKSNGDIERIHAIPPNGTSIDESIKFKKTDLIPAVDLKLIFKSILYQLYSNASINNRTLLCNEITKILFCKIYDERLDRAEPYFQVLPDKTDFQIRRNIQKNLWEPVLKELEETTGIFRRTEKIELDPVSVRFVVGELEQLSLLKTDHDVIGAAFEVFAERYFVGEKGEFFTPRIAIKNAIKMLNPQYADIIIDPACGSGGFIIYALEHIWEAIDTSGLNKEATRRQAPSFIYGIDKEPTLVKVARAYMALIGDGATNIADTDSLMHFDDWNEKARVMLADDNGNIKEFDFVFTNPPFGADIKVKSHSILEHYDLGHKWTKAKNSSRWVKSDEIKPTEPQILFLELCVNRLKEGGRLCIVLPEGIFGNANTGYVRQWLLENTTVLAVWDCPEPLFLPHTDTKTCMLFAERSKSFNQSIMMSFISECGHDRRGAEIRGANGELIEDFSKALADWHDRPPENSVDPQAWSGSISAMVQGGDLIDDNLLVPRIYQIEHKLGSETKRLGDLETEGIISIKTVNGKVNESEYDDEGEIDYVRTSDLGVMELRPSVRKVPLTVYKRVRKTQDLQPLDILVIKSGKYLIGESLMLSKDDVKIVVQNEFYKIRVLDNSKLDPYFLLYALKKSQSFIRDSALSQSTLSRVNIGRMRSIPIPYPSSSGQAEIGSEMREILEQRRENREKLNSL